LRRELWRRGLRYRLHVKGVFGRPDIVFKTAKVAVFVDGDFWHARAIREQGESAFRSVIRSKNQDWWVEKLRKNRDRDDLVTATLRESGWTVLRYWESAVLADPTSVASLIEKVVRTR
jgi:DNA mismatch endonuclease (patch repair protein)